MILLVVTREARGSSRWQPISGLLSYLCCWWVLLDICMRLPPRVFGYSVLFHFLFLFLFLPLCTWLPKFYVIFLCNTVGYIKYFLSFSWYWRMRHTSHIHSSESTLFLVLGISPSPLLRISLDISSIRIAYFMTDNTPPCLMSYLVWLLAVSWEFSFFTMDRFFPSIPFLFRTYSIASNHALYAFWTSRKVTHAVLPSFHISWIICFSAMRWSVVALASFPPTWASVIWVISYTFPFMIRSYTLPTLLARVIPLSLEHFPSWPLPLYSLMIFPLSHGLGMISSSWTLFIILIGVLVVSWLASRNISFGMSAGPWLFFLMRFQ